MNEHPTVEVSVGEWSEQIDVEIAPLIEQIWRSGIETTNSCQENPTGRVWIEFLTAFDAADFLDAVVGGFSQNPNSMYARIRQDSEEKERWEYSVHPRDASLEQVWLSDDEMQEVPTGPPEFVFSHSIRFPKSDLPLVIERMRGFNESERGMEYRAKRGRVCENL